MHRETGSGAGDGSRGLRTAAIALVPVGLAERDAGLCRERIREAASYNVCSTRLSMISGAPQQHSIVLGAKRVLGRLFPSQFDRKAPTGVQLCDLNGVLVKLDFSCPVHVGMYWSGGFEPELTRIIARVTRPGDIFVDIGANIGWHSFSLLRHRPTLGMTYMFEPSSSTFDMLVDGIAANGFTDKCRPYKLALSSRSGTARFKTFDEFGATHSSLYALADWSYEEEDVLVDTLDSVARSFGAAPSIVKCDVEGAERDVLLGAADVLQGRFGPPPMWFLEANYESAAMAGYAPYELATLAQEKAGYKPYYVRADAIVPLPRPTALRHGDTLILAIPDLHRDRLLSASKNLERIT